MSCQLLTKSKLTCQILEILIYLNFKRKSYMSPPPVFHCRAKKEEVMIKAYHVKTYHCTPLLYIWNLILVGEMTKQSYFLSYAVKQPYLKLSSKRAFTTLLELNIRNVKFYAKLKKIIIIIKWQNKHRARHS